MYMYICTNYTRKHSHTHTYTRKHSFALFLTLTYTDIHTNNIYICSDPQR